MERKPVMGVERRGNQYRCHGEKRRRHALSPASSAPQVKLNGEVIADSSNALVLEEGTYPPVCYFPRRDVKMDRLVRSSHSTHCPFKGHASYFSLKGGAENAVWTYETPFDEMLAIKELLAFYPDKVEIKTL
jgi:uncharacterized protein (DUF427 family)